MVTNTLNGIWVAMGFMRWPLAFSLLAVVLLSMYSVGRLYRPSATADLLTKAWLDAVLFWGGFAMIYLNAAGHGLPDPAVRARMRAHLDLEDQIGPIAAEREVADVVTCDLQLMPMFHHSATYSQNIKS